MFLAQTTMPASGPPIHSIVRWSIAALVAGVVVWVLMSVIPAIKKQRRLALMISAWKELASSLGLEYFSGGTGGIGSVWGQNRDGRVIGIAAEVKRSRSRFKTDIQQVATARVSITSAKSAGRPAVPDSLLRQTQSQSFQAVRPHFAERLVQLGSNVEIEDDWLKAGPFSPWISPSSLKQAVELLAEMAENIENATGEILQSQPETAAATARPDQGQPPEFCPHCRAKMLPGQWVCQMCGRDARAARDVNT